jgi:hypothetical protein
MIRSSGKMTLTIDQNSYLQLWVTAKISPKVIETETEYRQFLVAAENLLTKKKLAYSRRNYPVPVGGKTNRRL